MGARLDPPGEVRPPAAADFLAAFRAGARRVPAFLVGARFLAFLAGARLTAFLTAFLVGARFLAFLAGARLTAFFTAFLVGARFLAFLAGARLTAFFTAFLVGARFLAAFLGEARRFAATTIARPSELTWRRLSFDDGRTALKRYLSRSSMTGMSPHHSRATQSGSRNFGLVNILTW